MRLWLIIIAMGVVCVPTLDRWGGLSDVSATGESVIMLAGFALILGVMARNAWRGVAPEDEDGPEANDELAAGEPVGVAG